MITSSEETGAWRDSGYCQGPRFCDRRVSLHYPKQLILKTKPKKKVSSQTNDE